MAAITANGSLDHTNLHPPQSPEAYTPPPRKNQDMKYTNGNRLARGSALNMDDMAICASPGSYMPSKLRKRYTSNDQPAESLGGLLRRFAVQHQLGISLNFMLLVAMSYVLFPSLRMRMGAFLWLSYRAEEIEGGIVEGGKAMFGQGPRDLNWVASCVICFTAVRAFMLEYVLAPLAGRLGVEKKKLRMRFAEQSYLFLFYCFYWPWGVYLFTRDTPSSLAVAANGEITLNNVLISMWTHFPRLLVDAQMKIYYLSQLAFWAQQIMVVHLEERRKDHYQMLTHHFTTVALMSTSYGFRQLRVGNAVLVCMDFVDLFFPSAKCLKYIGWQKTCDAAFGAFVFAWLFARHIAYGTICWSIYAHVNNDSMPYGTYSLTQHVRSGPVISGLRLSEDGGDSLLTDIYQPFVNPEAETLVFNANIRWTFLGMLGFLQCITIAWFVLIVNVVIKVLKGEGAEDTRSDDEGDDEEEEEEEELEAPSQASVPFIPTSVYLEEKQYIEVEANSSDLHYNQATKTRTSGGSNPKRKGFSSGLNLGDRKDILNRIGCLSDEQLAREKEKREDSASPRR